MMPHTLLEYSVYGAFLFACLCCARQRAGSLIFIPLKGHYSFVFFYFCSMSKRNGYIKKIADHAAKNAAEGLAFLLDNKTKPEVISLPSGLQYEVLIKGEGKVPQKKSKVLCHYRGTLLDGTVFDNSYSRQKPEAFYVHELIKGWQEALQLMPVGSKWKLYIPYNLGYGFEALTKDSGGNCTLIFEMELIALLT